MNPNSNDRAMSKRMKEKIAGTCENDKCEEVFLTKAGLKMHKLLCPFKPVSITGDIVDSEQIAEEEKNTNGTDLATNGLLEQHQLHIMNQVGMKDEDYDVHSKEYSDEGMKKITHFNRIYDYLNLFASKTSMAHMNDFRHQLYNCNPNVLKYLLETRLEFVNTLIPASIMCSKTDANFEKVVIDDGEYRIIFFCQNAKMVLQKLINLHKYSDLVKPDNTGHVRNHPMHGLLGREAVPAIKKHVMEDGVGWLEEEYDGIESVVLLLKIYNDKAFTTLSQGGIAFHPIHLNVVNFTKEAQDFNIVNGHTLLGFLPTSILKKRMKDGIIEWIPEHNIDRMKKMKLIQKAMERTVQPIVTENCRGILCRTADGRFLNGHTTIGINSADLLGSKEMLGLKQGNRVTMPCHRCKCKPHDMTYYSEIEERSGKETNVMMSNFFYAENLMVDENLSYNQIQEIKGKATEKLNEVSQHPIYPVFHAYPFTNFIPVLDLYRTHSIDPLHCLHIGISKLLKVVLCELLKETDDSTHAVRTVEGKPKLIKTLRTPILHQLNSLIEAVSTRTDGPRISIKSNNEKCPSGLNGIFKKDGICGMVEAVTFKKLDMISPFLGAIVDRVCGCEESAPITTVFTQYVDIMMEVCGYGKIDNWTEEAIEYIAGAIECFKANGVRVFGKYQKSGMGTNKWHLLDHIPYDLQRNCGLQFTDTGLYEFTHSLFKFFYRSASKRVSTALKETIVKMEDNNSVTFEKHKRERCTEDDTENPVTKKIKNDELVEADVKVARQYATFTVQQLCDLTEELDGVEEITAPLVQKLVSKYDLRKQVFELICNMEDTAREVMCKLVKEYCHGNRNGGEIEDNFMIKVSRSFSLYGIRPFTGKDVDDDGKILIDENEIDAMQEEMIKKGSQGRQRLFSTGRYLGQNRPRFDTVMLRGDLEDGEEDVTNIWFGKILAIIEISCTGVMRPGTNRCAIHNEEGCKHCVKDGKNRFVLVQYYDVIPPSVVPLDAIETVLNCVRLVWSRSNPYMKGMDAGKQYGLCPVESVLGKAFVVPAYGATALIHNDVKNKKLMEQIYGPVHRWEGKSFYVNRFYWE